MASDPTEPPNDSASRSPVSAASPDAARELGKPKLRRVERIERGTDHERVLILRDPMGVAQSFALDAEFAPVLDLLDGTRTAAQIGQSLRMRGVLDLPKDDLEAFVGSLSDEGWLDDEVFRDRWASLHAAFLDQDPRHARFAGVLYPQDPAELRARFDHHVGHAIEHTPGCPLAGVLVPHGPLELVGPVMGRTLAQLPPAAEVECVLVLGTDHGPGLLPYAAARRGFQTPLGPVPTHGGMLDALERRIGWAFREEVRHRDAHSVELAAVALRAIYGPSVPPMIGILCGAAVLRARETEAGERFVGALERLVETRRVLVWGSAELSHGGVAYGRPALDRSGVAGLEDRDRSCLDDVVHGRLRALHRKCIEDHPQGRPSGGAVLSTLRQLLPEARAEVAAYQSVDIGPADSEPADREPGEHARGRSVAGLAGVRFYRR